MQSKTTGVATESDYSGVCRRAAQAFSWASVNPPRRLLGEWRSGPKPAFKPWGGVTRSAGSTLANWPNRGGARVNPIHRSGIVRTGGRAGPGVTEQPANRACTGLLDLAHSPLGPGGGGWHGWPGCVERHQRGPSGIVQSRRPRSRVIVATLNMPERGRRIAESSSLPICMGESQFQCLIHDLSTRSDGSRRISSSSVNGDYFHSICRTRSVANPTIARVVA